MRSQKYDSCPTPFALKIQKLQNTIFYNLGGPKLFPPRYLLNFFKGITFLWIIGLMNYFDNYSYSMYLYLALHGSYGICWITKDLLFPDQRFTRKGSVVSHMILLIVLISYWMIPLPLAAGYGITNPSRARVVFLVILYATGIILMMGADYQKNTTLKKQKGLISSAFFKYTRNPNYLGEIMIYSSFVFCSGHVLGFLIFYSLGGILFALNIYIKDEISFKRKLGWNEYKNNSYVLLPKIFQTYLLNFVFYACMFASLGYFLIQESPKTFFYPLDLYLSFN